MFRGFYTAGSGMLAQQRRTEILTNNLANVNTPGYKTDESSLKAFPEMLLQRMETDTGASAKNRNLPFSSLVGSLNTGVYVHEVTPRFTQGGLQHTGLATDFALNELAMNTNEAGIKGSIFFTMENPAGGVLYSRNGQFTLDGEGFLTSSSGYYILDEEGNRIQLSNTDFTVNNNGWIEQNGQTITRIGVGYAENPFTLTKGNHGYYSVEGNLLPSAYENGDISFAVSQGYTEMSNVDSTQTMTELLSAYRTFEANQKVLQAYDRSMEKAVNEIGKI